MEENHKKSKISLSKPEDIPQSQDVHQYDTYIDPTPYQQNTPQYQNQQYSQPQQTTYQEDNARRLPKFNMPDTYQQENSPVPRNSPFQNSNYNRTRNNPNTKFCKYCGGIIPFNAVICTKCGCQVENLQGNSYQQNNTYINNMNVSNINNTRISRKNRSVAGVLCALGFFGLGGLHRIYTGHLASGILYMCTYGLFGIGTIVDLVRLIQGTFTDSQGNILKD